MSQNKWILRACMQGDKGLKELEERRDEFLFSIQDENANTLLHYACQTRVPNQKLLIFLIQNGVSVEQVNDEGNTALHFLCYIAPHNIDGMSILLKAGAPIDAVNHYGMTSLHTVYDGRLRPVVQNPQEKSHAIEFYRFQCKRQYPETIQFLLKQKANPNISNQYGDTVGHTLLMKSRLKQDMALLCHYQLNINAQNKQGKTLLHILSDMDYLYNDLICYLMRQGADILLCDNKNKTPLHYLCKRKTLDFSLINWCIDKQSLHDPNNMQNHLADILSVLYARSDLNTDSVSFLQEHHFDLNQKNKSGNTLLHRICMPHNPNSYLIHYMLFIPEIDLDSKNNGGLTALHMLAKKKLFNEGILRFFLTQGADPNITNKKGETLLDLLMGQEYSLSLRLFVIAHGGLCNKKHDIRTDDIYFVTSLMRIIQHYDKSIDLAITIVNELKKKPQKLYEWSLPFHHKVQARLRFLLLTKQEELDKIRSRIHNFDCFSPSSHSITEHNGVGFF